MNLAQFRDHLLGKGYAERTVAEYVKWVRRLHHWAADRLEDPDTLPTHLVRAFTDQQAGTWATRKQVRAALLRYYTALNRTDSPWEAVRVPAKPKPRPSPHETAEAERLRDAAILHGGRPGLAVLLLLYTGARAAEVAGMTWEEVDLRRAVIRWRRPKVSDEHELPIAPPLADALRKHAATAPPGAIFYGNVGRPHVRPQTIWQWTKNVAALADVDTSPKRLRSTLANHLLEATRDVDMAAAVLGHRSAETTRSYYTDTSQERIAEGMGQVPY